MALATALPAMAQDAPGPNLIEELVVTAQKKEEALQDVPIAVSAFDQNALEKSKIDGGPNLVLAVPNVNFGKSNFIGYNFQIRGIGSKLVAASGDAGTGIHLNNAPLIANNLFETEFYDMERVEVLRGPQGTLYGRNATGGVVNLITAKPTDQFEGMVRAEYGNYDSKKLRGMVNVPLGEMFAVRLAGNYLKRDGFGENLVTGHDVDARDLWSGRATVSFSPADRFRLWALLDHFEEHDSRSRTGKQFCTKDVGPETIGGLGYSSVPPIAQIQRGFFSQGCLPTSAYSPSALGTYNSQASISGIFAAYLGLQTGDGFAGKTQAPGIRDIETPFDPVYKSKTDTYELNAEFDVTDQLKLTALSAYTVYKLSNRQDFTRYTTTAPYNATPNPVNLFAGVPGYASIYAQLFPGGVINDPQLGPYNSQAVIDQSNASSDQWSHEVRLQSNFDGPLNFNVGGLYLKFKNRNEYIVTFNSATAFSQMLNLFNTGNPNCFGPAPCIAVDPNRDPTGQGHNYLYVAQPVSLTSYAAFGELYWQATETLKWTVGLRYSVDDKSLLNHPLALVQRGIGLSGPLPGQDAILKAKFKKPTGRVGFDWKPDLGFTRETLIYAFYSRGYKAGGLNPPFSPGLGVQAYPATFAPELIDSYEIGTKNTLLDGSLQVNLTAFHYDYKDYQIAKIQSRVALNENIGAKVDGVEFESIWQPLQGLRLNAAVGYLDTKIGDAASVDVADRTQGRSDLTVAKNSLGSNCVISTADARAALAASNAASNPFLISGIPGTPLGVCGVVSEAGAGTNINGSGAIAAGSNSFGGLLSEGVPVQLKGKALPNAPHWTVSLGAQYTWSLGDWETTLRGDYYHQSKTYARIYNSVADRIKAWDNLNVTLTVVNDEMGLELGAFVKNATNEKVIADMFTHDESAGLFRNAFYTDPRTYGVSLTKRW
ncbi:TonB-dependent receptor [Phenylobacterium sp.]|uniref:TonB-dependent receptor n=1 Tax=Phenylobacterium sp. TaxID=1871053 RepID=UPI002ED7E48E